MTPADLRCVLYIRLTMDRTASKDKILVNRRMYHVSLGLLEAGLYGVPTGFICGVFLFGLPFLLTLAIGLVGWGAVWVWVMRRAEARFRASTSRPAASIADLSTRLQDTVLRYTALASGILLAFTVIPVLLTRADLAAGLWFQGGEFGVVCFLILLLAALGYSAVGLVPSLRNSIFPEYPGFVAAMLFDLAVAAFFLTNIIGV